MMSVRMLKTASGSMYFYTTIFLVLAMLCTAAAAEPRIVPLIAGQHIDAGSVSVSNTETTLTVTYQATGGWAITETHLDVATSYNGLYTNKAGNPQPGKFRYKTEHPAPVSEVTFTIDATAWAEGALLYIAAHAVVVSETDEETAWAGDLDFPGANWATYFTYTIQAVAQAGVVQFSQPEFPVEESSRDTRVTLIVKRVGGSAGSLAVHYRTLDGTAIGNPVPRLGDYVSKSGTLTFGDGDDADKSFDVVISTDPIDTDLFENFFVELTTDDGCCLGDPSTTTVIIEDFRN